MKNTVWGIYSRLDDTEEHKSDVEEGIMEVTKSEHQKEKQIR